jgi:glycerophosphoryl diester phosphodiesterase
VRFASGRAALLLEVKACEEEPALEARVLPRIQALGGRLAESAPAFLETAEQEAPRRLALTRAVLSIVREEDGAAGVTLQSFSPVIVALVRCLAPELPTALLSGVAPDDGEKGRALSAWLEFIGPAGLNLEHRAIGERDVCALHNAGRTVAAWTVDEPGEMMRVANLGVDAIITNRPDLCRDVLRDSGASGSG